MSVQPFTVDLMVEAVKKKNWRYSIDSDGDVSVVFTMQDLPFDLNAYFSAQGTNKEIFRQFAMIHRQGYPRDQWARILWELNAWNRAKRWPKAYLDVKEDASGEAAYVILEHQFDLEKGVTVDLLVDWMGQFTATCDSFWRWLIKEKNLPPQRT